MKKLLAICAIVALVFSVRAQTEDSVDVRAVVILDRMSDIIGDMRSCSFQLNTGVDRMDPQVGVVKEYFKHNVFLVGPDKMHIQTHGPKDQHGYWYNGDLLMYYSLTFNHYGFIETPDNIVETIEMVNRDFGVDFPAADFFYPSFTDDLLEHSDRVDYLGLVLVDGVHCHHIIANGSGKHIQLWISNDTFTLPVRYSISEESTGCEIRYEGIFSDWKINPELPDAIFDFVVPESARKLNIASKNIK